MKRAEEDTVKMASRWPMAGARSPRTDSAPKKPEARTRKKAEKAECEFGEPVRVGAKPHWYRKLFHH
jgi:hypothetical protein